MPGRLRIRTKGGPLGGRSERGESRSAPAKPRLTSGEGSGRHREQWTARASRGRTSWASPKGCACCRCDWLRLVADDDGVRRLGGRQSDQPKAQSVCWVRQERRKANSTGMVQYKNRRSCLSHPLPRNTTTQASPIRNPKYPSAETMSTEAA